jgi:dipeptide/tripeptide permease
MWNLSESELLLTTAELSVAFAGFASLAGILGRRMSRDDPRVDSGRLINMLTISLGATAIALAPLLPMLFGWSQGMVWRLSGTFGLLLYGAIAPGLVRRARQMRQFEGYNPVSNAINFTLAGISVAALLCCIIGLPPANPFATYYGALLALLAQSAILFFRVIASLLRPNAPDEA